MPDKIKNFYLKYEVTIFAVLSFLVPSVIYVLTLEPKLLGGDTTWYALYLPQMQVMVPTGYPFFSIVGKLFSIIPLGDLAYRLNLISVFFGAPTVLFLFLATNKLIKNAPISFASSMTFAFLFSYWTVANRLEFDTINSLFVVLMLYSAFLYAENPKRKYLYFFTASLGFSLTNHPLAFFIMPTFILYIILLNPKIFKSAKAVFLSILFFILPLSLYAWLPIMSLQGHGEVTTLKGFIYYITGRNVAGEVHGGSFRDKDFGDFINVSKDFFTAIYDNFGIILLIIAFIGLIYLFWKNWKFASCSVFMIILNIIIISRYLPYSPPNYSINAMIVISIYLAAGFKLIYDFVLGIIKKWQDKKQAGNLPETAKQSKAKYFSYFIISILVIIFLLSPTILIVKNYKEADWSEPIDMYLFWDDIFDYLEEGSVLYVFSSSENIGMFINKFERQDKNITLITHKDKEYAAENVIKDAAEGKKVYFVGTDNQFKPFFNLKQIKSYTWERMRENVVFYSYDGEKEGLNIPEISYNITKKEFEFGEKFQIEYTISNKGAKDLEITSIELLLPENLRFLNLDQESFITIEPSLYKGIYMWVKTLPVKAGSEVKLILNLQATMPGEAIVEFSITSQGSYFNAEDISIDISG